MIHDERNYVYGSTAEKLEYDVNELFEEKSRQRTGTRHKTNNKARLKAVAVTLALFAACFIVMIRYSIITELSYKVDSVNQQYEALKNENSRLKVDIDKATDLNRIMEIAQTQLGMQKPDKFQTVYVSVPKQDFTEVADKYKNGEKSGNVFAALIDKVGKIAGLLN